MEFIDLVTQQARIRSRVESAMRAVMDHGRYVRGPEVASLEARLAEYVGVAHCVSCASGTDALQIAQMALGIGPGDEVIVPGFSFIATAESVALTGASPVYVDIEPESYLLDARQLEAVISPRTRAIIAVSLFGQCAEFETINRIAERHALTVIEDAAQSFGATRHGKRSGNLSHIACTSFFPSKPLGAYGDGGAILTQDESLADAMRCIANHGESERYRHASLGLNSRLDTLQAAVLLAKLDIFEDELARREEVAARYDRLLQDAGIDTLPQLLPGNRSVYSQYSIRLDERDKVRGGLQRAGVPTAIHYPVPLHRQPAVADETCHLPVAESVCQHILSLPMHPYLEALQQTHLVDALRATLDSLDN